MATIRLDHDVLEAERFIDERDQAAALEALSRLRDRLGRRPEMRYLQIFYDAMFEKRPDTELIADLNALVIEQPDFLEAVAVLAWLLARTGDRMRATVFAREAVQSKNDRARRRAEKVLGRTSKVPGPDERMRAGKSSFPPPSDGEVDGLGGKSGATKLGLGSVGNDGVVPGSPPTPAFAPSPFSAASADMAASSMATDPARRRTAPASSKESSDDPLALPSEPPIQADGNIDPFGHRSTTGRAITQDRAEPGDSVPPGVLPALDGSDPSTRPTRPPLESSPFGELLDDPLEAATTSGGLADLDAPATSPPPKPPEEAPPVELPPRPTIDADEVTGPSPAVPSEPSAIPGFRAVKRRSVIPPMPPPAEDEPSWSDHDEPRPQQQQELQEKDWSTGRLDLHGFRRPPSSRDRIDQQKETPSVPPVRASEAMDPGRHSAASGPGRSVTGDGVEKVKAWFRYAEKSQLRKDRSASASGPSTSATLLALAERVVEGETPLSDEPVSLDRRGLILVERRLERFRSNRGSTQTNERVLVTASAAFLMAVLLKECEGEAVDIAPEDGGCKVVLPSGATLRPLLVTATFLRSRGPGLVQSFDRVATAHMRRSTRTSRNMRRMVTPVTRPRPGGVSGATPVPGATYLSTPLRDLDAGTIAVLTEEPPRLAPPGVDMAGLAREFWSTDLGRELTGGSGRVGRLTIADVDTIESYASRVFDVAGLCPPGHPWPWVPNPDQMRLIESWGAVLGEVLIALYGGRWEADPVEPDEPRLFRTVLSEGVVAWPVAQVYLRLARGIVHELSTYVDVVGRMSGLSSVRR